MILIILSVWKIVEYMKSHKVHDAHLIIKKKKKILPRLLHCTPSNYITSVDVPYSCQPTSVHIIFLMWHTRA